METMRFREVKKSSYKGQIFFILLFLFLGAGITYFAVCNEKEPMVLGNSQSDITTQSNLAESNALVNVDVPVENPSELYKITNKGISSDKTIKKLNANITLPVICINDELLTKINNEIYNKFNEAYTSYKNSAKDFGNNYTYTVSYKVYDNIVANKNVISITIYERMNDDVGVVDPTVKVYTYNINLKDGSILKQEDVVIDILGPTYKDKIRNGIKDFVINGKKMKEDEYNYSYTGLETYYIKENKLHLIFNPGNLLENEYLDIII